MLCEDLRLTRDGKEEHMRRLLGAGGAVLLGAAVIALVGVGFSAQAYSSPRGVQKATSLGTDMTCGKALPHVTLSFATYADASGTNDAGQQVHPGGNPSWPSYGPTNIFQAPAHACVTMHITQYDSGGSLNNPVFAKVQGTIGDTESVVSSGNSVSGCDGTSPLTFDGTPISAIQPCDVGHTFSLRGLPGIAPGFFVNVPLPLAGNAAGDNVGDLNSDAHQTVTFSFIAGPKGTYAWNCEYPCGLSVAGFGAVMGAYGYMSGYLHVV